MTFLLLLLFLLLFVLLVLLDNIGRVGRVLCRFIGIDHDDNDDVFSRLFCNECVCGLDDMTCVYFVMECIYENGNQVVLYIDNTTIAYPYNR